MSAASPHVARLQTAVAAVARMLESYARRRALSPTVATPDPAATSLGPPVAGSALDAVAHGFALSAFEVATLALGAGMEISPEIAGLCALAQADPGMAYPTSLLALAVFADVEGAS